MKLSFAKKLTASYLFVATVTLLITGVFLSHHQNLWTAGAAAFLIAIGVAWITMRKISQPLRDLLASMGVETQDELGHLARTYSDMAAVSHSERWDGRADADGHRRLQTQSRAVCRASTGWTKS